MGGLGFRVLGGLGFRVEGLFANERMGHRTGDILREYSQRSIPPVLNLDAYSLSYPFLGYLTSCIVSSMYEIRYAKKGQVCGSW